MYLILIVFLHTCYYNHASHAGISNDLYLYIEEAKTRAVEGLATSQPLAKLLPRLLETQRLANNELNVTSDSQSINIANPKYMRMHIENTLVETLKQILTTCSSVMMPLSLVFTCYLNSSTNFISLASRRTTSSSDRVSMSSSRGPATS